MSNFNKDNPSGREAFEGLKVPVHPLRRELISRQIRLHSELQAKQDALWESGVDYIDALDIFSRIKAIRKEISMIEAKLDKMGGVK